MNSRNEQKSEIYSQPSYYLNIKHLKVKMNSTLFNLVSMNVEELKNSIAFFGKSYEQENTFFEIMKNFCNTDYKMSIYGCKNDDDFYIDFTVSNASGAKVILTSICDECVVIHTFKEESKFIEINSEKDIDIIIQNLKDELKE